MTLEMESFISKKRDHTYLTCCCALLLMVKFCARLARLLSKSPVRTLPVLAAPTGCPAAEIILNSRYS